MCAKAFISKALSPGLNCLIERNDDLACIKRDLDTFSTAAGPEGVDLSRSAGYISSAIVVIMESIINEMHSIPDEVVALGSYLWRAAKVKFPYVKSNHVGGFIFSRLIGPSLLSPESISTANIAGDKSKENAIDGLKTVTKIILAACSPKFSIRDSFFPYIEKEVDVTCDKVRMTFISFVVKTNKHTNKHTSHINK